MYALRLAFVLVLLACALPGPSGCASMSRWASRDESERRAALLQEVQLKVMRYADDYSARITDPIESLHMQSMSPEERLRAHDWRIQQSTAAYTIASGPNPIINALDMIVLATLSRMVVEQESNAVAGARVVPLLNVHRDLERLSWELVAGVTNKERTDELRALIAQWRATHPEARAVSQVRLADFAAIVDGRSKGTPAGGGGVFALIGLDPLSNLDPAVRELEQTRLLAERTIYYLQRSPGLLEMQVERLTYQLAVTPEVKGSLDGIERISFAAEELGKLSVAVPALIASERDALIAELKATLHAEQGRILALLVETRAVLQSGTQASDSVRATVAALDAFVARFQPNDAPPSSVSTPRRPFDITEYAQTARELAKAAHDLHALLVQVDSSSTSVQILAATTAQGFNEVIDRAFLRGIVLITVLALVTLFAALAYRYVSMRWSARLAVPPIHPTPRASSTL